MAVRMLRGSGRNDVTGKYATHWFKFPSCMVLVGLSNLGVGNASKYLLLNSRHFGLITKT